MDRPLDKLSSWLLLRIQRAAKTYCILFVLLFCDDRSFRQQFMESGLDPLPDSPPEKYGLLVEHCPLPVSRPKDKSNRLPCRRAPRTRTKTCASSPRPRPPYVGPARFLIVNAFVFTLNSSCRATVGLCVVCASYTTGVYRGFVSEFQIHSQR